MATNALTRTLQLVYPIVIFLAVIAGVKANWFEAGSPNHNSHFKNDNTSPPTLPLSMVHDPSIKQRGENP
jgi:hypothetical protein